MTEISSLTGLGAAPADGDQFVILDVSDTTQSANGTTKKLAASRVARVGSVNTFTKRQVINGASADAVDPLAVQVDSVQVASVDYRSSVGYRINLPALDMGGQRGRSVQLGRDTDAGNGGASAAAAFLQLERRSGTTDYVWVDATGNVRINTSVPTSANDTSGTVVGAQTSWHAVKQNVEEWDGAEALDAIRSLTLYSYQMIEDSQETPDGGKPTYRGIVIMDEDREANAWFGLGYAENQVPALNDRNLFGYMLAAIRHGGDIIEALQTQVAALEARVSALEGA